MLFRSNNDLSSTHILYPLEEEAKLLAQSGFMLRRGVQFHWENPGYQNFEEFLSTLEQKKRKNIRAERRKVADAGIRFRQLRGTEVTEADWIFFKRCYDRTYRDHHSSPYLNLDFFLRIGASMPSQLQKSTLQLMAWKCKFIGMRPQMYSAGVFRRILNTLGIGHSLVV